MRVEIVRRLFSLLRPQRGLVVASVLFRIANQSLGVAIPAVAVALVIAAGEGSANPGTAMLVLAVLALVKGAFRYLEQYTGHAVAFRLLAHLRNEVFRWLERLEPARLEDERSGDLVARVSGDIDRVEPFYAHTIAPLVAAVVVPLLTLAGLAWVGGIWVVLALAPFVVLYLAVVPWLGLRRVAESGSDAPRLSGETAAAVADLVQGAREIAVLGAKGRIVAELLDQGRRRAVIARGFAASAAKRSLVGGVLAAGALLAVAIAAIASGLGLQELVVSIVTAWAVMAPMRALEQIVPDTEQSLAAAARLFELEDLLAQGRGEIDSGPPDSGVRFAAVTVRAGDAGILDTVDIDVPGGSMLGIVGPSGSGKSTLVQTLVRQRDPDSGSVTLGGRSVSELTSSRLARDIALVPQRPDFFYGSLASNLLVAKADAESEEMLAALERAGLADWVEGLEDGLATHLGEGGVGMSGGQLQRLALARAFLRDPAVLVLDEATSELDAATERAVLNEVYSERGRRTLIVVAHRMETVITADRIAVMDKGRVVEWGTHAELETADGLYAALWERHRDMLTRV
ncbi:MAG TPA: ABC transporter ATP-binding protein [Acidimicrobiia bacterium]|nr:ABC transporter ATP-binding protein [Acidimicrobiia bacterium]